MIKFNCYRKLRQAEFGTYLSYEDLVEMYKKNPELYYTRLFWVYRDTKTGEIILATDSPPKTHYDFEGIDDIRALSRKGKFDERVIAFVDTPDEALEDLKYIHKDKANKLCYPGHLMKEVSQYFTEFYKR